MSAADQAGRVHGDLYTTTVEESTDIAASRATVWRALVDPARVMAWDTGIVRAIDAPADYPRPGQTVRWQYRLLGLPVVLVDRPQDVVPLERLRTLIALAFLRIDETYTLEPLADDRTRLTARLLIGNTLPVLRRAFDRRIGRGLAEQTIATSLRALREFCEREQAANG